MNFAIIWSGICVTRGRDGARARLGPATRLLANAFGVVTARIDRFIAEGSKGPYPDME
jgi:hypothetical protein